MAFRSFYKPDFAAVSGRFFVWWQQVLQVVFFQWFSTKLQVSAQVSSEISLGCNEEDEAGDEDEELVPDVEERGMSLEEVLQSEAEVLAAELEELEQEGIAPDVVEGLESGVEQAAESLVTMREARSKIAEIKKDRGYGKTPGQTPLIPGGKPRMTGNQVNGKKPKSSCWDCGQTGHWAGDHGCPSPGAGLFKPKGGAKPQDAHEVLTATCIFQPSTLSEALWPSFEVCATQIQSLALDKKLMGALDSACTGHVVGPFGWSTTFVHYNLRLRPSEIWWRSSRSRRPLFPRFCFPI